MPIELSKISSFHLNTLSRQKTVFFFPVGPLEDHGPHLPLGLDLEEANRLCFLAAQQLEEKLPGWIGIVMPPAPLGLESNTSGVAITVRAHVLRDWLVDACRSLIRSNFIHFVCFSGHLGPKQLTAIEEAGKLICKTGRWSRRMRGVGPTLVSACSSMIKISKVLQAPFWPDPEEHGGRRDTSIGLAISNVLVHPQFVHLPKVLRISSKWQRNWKRSRRKLTGYWGNPSDGNQEAGNQEMSALLEEVFPKLRAVWEGANPNSLFRSWYSVLPPNKSFFRSWLLVYGILVFLVGLALLNSTTFSF